MPAWTYLDRGVCEHSSGARLHSSGLLKLNNGIYVDAFGWPESKQAWAAIKAKGNRTLGLLSWAEQKIGENK